MLSGLLFTAFLTLGQAETAPAPQKLPPVEGLRPQGSLPTPAEVALPLSTSGCPSCGGSQSTGGCASGNCYGSTCSTEAIGPPNAAWNDTIFDYYWFKPAPLPSLIASNGLILNHNPVDFRATAGANVAGGRWVNDAHTWGYGYNLFLTEQRATFQNFTSDGGGSPQFTRPFIDSLTNTPGTFFVSDPGRLSGTLHIENGARLAGGELYALKNTEYCKTKCFNLLAGFRYLDLDEYLVMYQQTSGIGAAPPTFTVAGTPTPGPVNIVDRFRTRNQFWGGEIGGQGEITMKCITFGVTSKVGIGNVHQTLDIAGQTTSSGAPTTTGGFLATSTNIGRINYNRIAVLADVSAQVGLQITEGSRLFVAYDFIYLNDVIRPGSQIDSVINTRFVPSSANFGTVSGPASPIRTQSHDDFYVHGLRFGYELQY
jgi:hypothetical protein